eukprot:1157841-Pelagomonas_calceolata.AAC.3
MLKGASKRQVTRTCVEHQNIGLSNKRQIQMQQSLLPRDKQINELGHRYPYQRSFKKTTGPTACPLQHLKLKPWTANGRDSRVMKQACACTSPVLCTGRGRCCSSLQGERHKPTMHAISNPAPAHPQCCAQAGAGAAAPCRAQSQSPGREAPEQRTSTEVSGQHGLEAHQSTKSKCHSVGTRAQDLTS